MKRTLLGLLPLLVACATKSEIKMLPQDAGVKAVYKETYEKVRRAAQDTAAEFGFKTKEEGMKDEHTWHFLASQGMSSGTSGRYLRVVIPTGEAERGVYVVVRSKAESVENQRMDDLLAQDIHKKIAGRLSTK